MKTSKSYLFGLVVLIGVSSFTFSQGDPVKEKEVKELKVQRVEAKAQPLSRLDLNETQQVEIKRIRKDYQLKLKEIRIDENMLEEDKRVALKALQKDRKLAVRRVLTEEQIAKLQNVQAQRLQKKDNLEYKRPSSEEMAARNVEKLNNITPLEERQKEELTEIYKAQFDKRQEIWRNSDLSKDQKKEEFKTLRTLQEKEVKKVLTKKQIRTLENYKKAKRESRKKK